MSTLYMLLGTLIALGVLVTFHEFGHFWVARRCGVKVLRFSVGFGTPLLTWHDKQGTEFVIAAIPLGGYVKMLDEREEEVALEFREQAFNRKTVGQRIAIVLAGPLANFILALLFFWVLALLGSEQVKPVIGAVTPDSLAAAAGLQVGDEIVSVDGEPTLGWSAVNLQLIRRLGESGTIELELQPADSSAVVRRQLQLADWLRGAEEPNPIAALGIQPWRPNFPAVLGEIEPDGPAQKAGLRSGDRLLAINDVPLRDWQHMVEQLQPLPDAQVDLQFERAGQVQSMQLNLGARGEGAARTGYLGIGPQRVDWPENMLREVSFGPVQAIGEAANRTWTMSLLTLDSIKKMLLGELSVKNLSGPITIAKVAGASAQSGLGEFLNFLAYLSISLGVLNLLPVPVLDGGHLLFYLAEWVRGRPLSDRIQAWGMQIGISMVVALMLLALVNDLGRL